MLVFGSVLVVHKHSRNTTSPPFEKLLSTSFDLNELSGIRNDFQRMLPGPPRQALHLSRLARTIFVGQLATCTG